MAKNLVDFFITLPYSKRGPPLESTSQGGPTSSCNFSGSHGSSKQEQISKTNLSCYNLEAAHYYVACTQNIFSTSNICFHCYFGNETIYKRTFHCKPGGFNHEFDWKFDMQKSYFFNNKLSHACPLIKNNNRKICIHCWNKTDFEGSI